MVYLDVYNSIFEYLEELEIVEDVLKYTEEILGPSMKNIHSNEVRNDLIVEFALYNYMYQDNLLINFLLENLYPKLDEEEKEEFELINESERFNLKFSKKEKINKLDTRGKELYDFYFEDIDNNKTKVIVSSTALDELKNNINARLIGNINYEGKYSIIGGIYDKKTFESIESLSSIKFMKERFDETKSNVKHILKFSKEHTLEEINNYKNEKSNFIKQDKKIMKINNLFFEKFNIGFDDFLNNFFELSNSNKTFIEMAEHYLSIERELNNVLFKTNYMFLPKFLFEKELIKGFASFIKKDSKILEQSILELKKKGKKEFENAQKTEISLSRENIIKNNKRFLSDKIAPLKPKGYDAFIKKINNYSSHQIKEFLIDVINYLDDLSKNSYNFEIVFFSAMIKDLLDKADEIPYLNEIKKKRYVYIPEEFYEYIGVNNEVYNLLVFLSAAYFTDKQNPKKAYELIIRNKTIKTKSFDMMFFAGKIFSFFDDKRYKDYFNQAKKIDKERYKNELNMFLKEKEGNKLTL